MVTLHWKIICQSRRPPGTLQAHIDDLFAWAMNDVSKTCCLVGLFDRVAKLDMSCLSGYQEPGCNSVPETYHVLPHAPFLTHVDC